MNHRTAKDRLMESLPPEQRPYFDRCLDRLSPNPDDPLIGLFAILAESNSANRTLIEAKMADIGQLETRLLGQITKGQAEMVKSVSSIVEQVTGKGLGWRIITNKILGTLIFVIVASTLANHIIQTKVRADPEVLQGIENVESKIKDRIDGQALLNNTKLDSIFNKVDNTASATITYETLLGKALHLYIFALDEKTITLQTGTGNSIILAHNLNPHEQEQLRITLAMARKIQTD